MRERRQLVGNLGIRARRTFGRTEDGTADSKNTVIEDGSENLDRANAGLAFSGLAAGLNISSSALALAAVGAMTGGGMGLVAMLFYPVGFLIVVLGRAQLFTENTVTPVAVVLTETNNLPNMLRFWAVVFASNILGAAIFAATITYGNRSTPRPSTSFWRPPTTCSRGSGT